MMTNKILGIALSGLVALGGASIASAGTRTNHIQARETRQQKRIHNGVASGKLNAKQEARIEKREAHISSRVAAAKASGHVGPNKRRHIRHRLHHEGQVIRRDKN